MHHRAPGFSINDISVFEGSPHIIDNLKTGAELQCLFPSLPHNLRHQAELRWMGQDDI